MESSLEDLKIDGGCQGKTQPIIKQDITAVYYEMDRFIAYSTLPAKVSYRHESIGKFVFYSILFYFAIEL